MTNGEESPPPWCRSIGRVNLSSVTVVRARQANLADLSDVALLKRLRKSKDWLYALCVRLFQEHGIAVATGGGFQIRAFDATTVKEPGKTGALWRIHWSVCLPSLACENSPAPRGRAAANHWRSSRSAPAITYTGVTRPPAVSVMRRPPVVDSSYGSIPVHYHCAPDTADLLAAVTSLKRTGAVKAWSAQVVVNEDHACSGSVIPGRVCALRKSAAAIKLALRKVRQEAARRGKQTQPDTLKFAEYVIVFTTFPAAAFSPADILEWYRIRWQVELVFKRFKSLAQLGHLPKYDDDSAKAWLYGKLLVALLVEKLIRHASAISPWGYHLAPAATTQPLRLRSACACDRPVRVRGGAREESER